MSRDYIVWTLPGAFAFVHFDSRKRYLQSMQYSSVATYTQVVTSVLHILWCSTFIVWLDLSVFGAALALNFTYTSNLIIQEFYVWYHKKVFAEYSAPLFDEESFLDWPLFIKLAIPTTLLMCLEWWAFEFLVIFAGILGVKELAA